MKNLWLTPDVFDLEYELVWQTIFPYVKRRDEEELELVGISPESLYKKSIEELKKRIKNLVPDFLFIYPFSGCDTLTTFGKHCIMIDTLKAMKEDELKYVKKIVKRSDNLDFIRADWNKPPLREDLEYNLIFKRSSSDNEGALEADLKNLASQQLSPKSVMFFDPGYYAPFFGRLRETTRRKDTVSGYKLVEIFSIRPEVRKVLQNPTGSVKDTVIIYSRINRQDLEKRK